MRSYFSFPALMFPAPAPSPTEITELQDNLLVLNEEALAIQARADGEKRDLTEDEQTRLDGIVEQFEATEAQIERRQKLAEMTARLAKPSGRKTDADPPAGDEEGRKAEAVAKKLPARAADTGKWGWRNFGEFAAASAHGSLRGGSIDDRLQARMGAATTWGSEGSGADGGFAVPPDFRSEIMQLVEGEASLLPFTDQLTSSTNQFSAPKDDTTPWQSSGGIQAYWEGEAGAYGQSKPLIKRDNVPLDKLTCLVPITEELLEDAPALDRYLRRKAPEKMGFRINLAILQGTGVGQPQGILNSSALISVAKETSQAADTILFNNLTKMWSRCYAPARLGAIWVLNQDIEHQLMTMTAPGGTFPAYLPANGLAGSPYGTLMGRPVIATQACETLGDKGDIMLVALRQYMTIQKVGGLRADTSVHLWFDQDLTAFKFSWRIGGRPWWTAVAPPRDGTNSLSPFVTLDERA